MSMRARKLLLLLVLAGLLPLSLSAQTAIPARIREAYDRKDVMIPMRDGVRLFAAVYTPKNAAGGPYPIIMARTPYGTDTYLVSIGPGVDFEREGYIFVLEDVRGCYKSEGEFEDVRPYNPAKKGRETDEASDAYDTIDWLVKNCPGNNGKVGVWGISYLGFYTTMAALSGHPALKAVSPQAPVTDWFLGDDEHHNGAFFLADSFDFLSAMAPRGPVRHVGPSTAFPYPIHDGYRFFLEAGSLADLSRKYMGASSPFWTEEFSHPDYDAYWKARTPLPHLKGLAPAVMTVGGWFDAEDVWGTIHTYRAIEKQNPGLLNVLVMGPWFHGQWYFEEGSQLGEVRWGAKTSEYYTANILLPFFNFYLKGKGDGRFPEAQVFETGLNRWRTFETWPPAAARRESIFLAAGGGLSIGRPAGAPGIDQYYSDPGKPVPYLNKISIHRPGGEHQYMVEDQRFAATRPDVLVYRSESLAKPLTVAGPITATIYAATTGTDADFIVKVIDVYPDDTRDPSPNPTGVRFGGYQQLLRGDVMRGRYRKGFETPVPFNPGEPELVEFELPDVLHTFKAGHRIMVQIQSSWFPIVDRNPQTFVDIYKAKASDFQPAWMRIYREPGRESKISVGILD